jgi:drug/metabolite transporter, DME family
VFIALRHRGRTLEAFRSAGGNGVIAALCCATAFTGFVFSITHTTVANTLFMLCAAPFLAALLGRVLLGERVSRATWIAMSVASVGVVVMVAEGIALGNPFGDLMALLAALGFAGFSVALRRGRNGDMLPAICLGATLSSAASLIMLVVTGAGLWLPLWDLMLCVVYGFVAVGLGMVIYTIGSRRIPAAELTLLSMSEVILGPIWVWIAFHEVPGSATLVGGAVLLSAIVGLALHGSVGRRPPIMPS